MVVSARTANMKETQPLVAKLEAEDDYFEEEPGLVGAFDFDYDTIIDFKTTLTCAQLWSCPCIMVCSSLACVPCFLKQNIEWTTRAQHVALTVDGIKYVVARHPSQCGLSCTDVGKVSKTVPYDKITDCDVQEPAGTACCCCIENVLPIVKVDTASSGGTGPEGATRHELELTGLVYPLEFKRSVWAMKRGDPIPALGYAGRPMAPSGGVTSAPGQMDMNSKLLTDILGELRQLNAVMRQK